MDWRDVGIRALKTAVQTAAALATVGVVTTLDLNALHAAAVAGVGGAWSVVQNALLGWSRSS